MRIHFWNIIRSIVFLSILTVSLYFINQMLVPKYILKNDIWPTTSSYEQFYQMDRNSVDVLFLGSSVCVNAFSPQEIYNEYGIRSYNLGSEQQSIFLSYYWLKEALRFQSPQVVVLDTRFLFNIHPENPINTGEGLIRKCLDPMKWSSVKREAVSELCDIDKEQSKLSFYFTNIRFHTRWQELTESDIIKKEYCVSELKGYGPIDMYESKPFNTFIQTNTKIMTEPQPIMSTYLDRIVELCKNEDIELILVYLPNNLMNDGINNMLERYSEDNKVDYYNLCENEVYRFIGADPPRENIVDHANFWGAIKISSYIGALLSKDYEVKAVYDEQYESTKEYYEQIKKNCELNHIVDMAAYLRAIQSDRYTVFISMCNEDIFDLTEQVKGELRNLGLETDFMEKTGWGYYAVISPETGVIELSTEKDAVMTGSVREKKTLYTISSSWFVDKTSINIDGVEYAKRLKGMNIVVYDNELMKVIDSVCFEVYGACRARR